MGEADGKCDLRGLSPTIRDSSDCRRPSVTVPSLEPVELEEAQVTSSSGSRARLGRVRNTQE